MDTQSSWDGVIRNWRHFVKLADKRTDRTISYPYETFSATFTSQYLTMCVSELSRGIFIIWLSCGSGNTLVQMPFINLNIDE